jgi:phage-related protein
MGQNFRETAHLKTDLKKFGDNYDQIDWTGTNKSLHAKALDTKQNKRQVSWLLISEGIKRLIRKAWLYLKGNCLGCL